MTTHRSNCEPHVKELEVFQWSNSVCPPPFWLLSYLKIIATQIRRSGKQVRGRSDEQRTEQSLAKTHAQSGDMSAPQKRQREEWFSLVDEIAANDAPLVLPSRAEDSANVVDSLSRFLPRPVPDGAVRHLERVLSSPEVTAMVLVPQMTYLEAMHALPVASRTDDHASDGKGKRMDNTQNIKALVAPLLKSVAIGNLTKPAGEEFCSGPFHQWYRKTGTQVANFIPIIILPSEPSAPIQLVNVRKFLENGKYVDPTEIFIQADGSSDRLNKTEQIIIQPGSFLPSGSGKVRTAFRKFKLVDDTFHIADWSQVCACFVTGKDWQFERWYPDAPEARHPSRLFHEIRGFLPFFEEDKVPPKINEWYVHPIQLNRKLTRVNASIRQTQAFWEELYKFLDSHQRFRQYTVAPFEER